MSSHVREPALRPLRLAPASPAAVPWAAAAGS
jgi:hypothetical protein